MKTAPAATIRLGASLFYRALVILVAIILVAACALFTGVSTDFTYKNAFILLLACISSSWALWDAWRVPHGALHYAAGQWVLSRGDVEFTGTLHILLDFPRYMLVSFQHSGAGVQPTHPYYRPQRFFSSPCLHLEPRHSPSWLALRRALVCKVSVPEYALEDGQTTTHG